MEVQKLVGVTADGAYGPMTEAAVKAWQANVGLYADGIFGPASRAKAYELAGSTGTVVTVPGCPAGAVYNNLTGLPCGTTTTTPVVTTPSTLTGGEADLSIDAESEDDLINNKAGQHAFTIEVEADDRGGDANIERMDLTFTLKTAPREDDIYDIIEAISLEVDGDEVASVDTDSRSDWKSQTIRLSGFDIVVKSGETAEIDVLLDIAKLDAADLDIVLELSNVEIRYTDAAGIVDIMDEDFTEKITIEDIDGIEFDADETSSNPASVTVSLNEDRDDVLVLSNDVEVDGQDGTVETVTVLFTMTFAGSKDLDDLDIDDLIDEVYFNGERADDIDEGTDGITFLAVFEDVDMDVEVGEEFEVEITVDFKEGDDFIGDTLVVTTVTFEGEGEDGEDFDEDMTPDEAPTVTLTGGALTLVDSVVKVNKLNNNEGEVVFTVEFENEGDDDITLAYLASAPTVPTAGNEYSAFQFEIGGTPYYAQADGTLNPQDDGGGTALAGYTVTIKNSRDVLDDNNDVIKEGKKEEYVITITIDATAVGASGTSGYYEVELTQVGYVLEAGATDVAGVLITNLESDDIYLSKNV